MKEFLRKIKDKLKIKLIFRKSKSKIGRIVSIKKPQYIILSKNVRIKDYCRIECFDDWNGIKLHPSLNIGDGVIIGDYFTCYITTGCIIGKDSIFAHNVTIVTENHGMNPELDIPFHRQQLINDKVIIGRNCWVGCGVTFLPGSEIGDNCVVAANSVVNKKFPSNVIIGGSPAKILKEYNFDLHQWVAKS